MASHPNLRLPEYDLRQMQLERFKIFESQDDENGHFDITFEIEGKKLQANKFILTPFSETMKVMISDRWLAKDQPVKIECYSYDNFYRFLRFLYTGSCEVTNESVLQMVDLAEFYGVQLLKQRCDKFLSEAECYTAENIEEMYELAQKYSLEKMKSAVRDFIYYRNDTIINAERFLSSKKSFVLYLTAVNSQKQKTFEGVCKWVEHQIMKQQPPATEDENFNLQEAIIAEVYTILPHPDFSSMFFEFLINFVLEKGFLLTPNHLKALFIKYSNLNEEIRFRQVYELAEKQALQKQKMSSDSENFDLHDSIKVDLDQIIPKIKFYKMSKEFLIDFVVPKQIITEEQANHVHDTRVRITNNGKYIYGVFKDEIGLRQAYDSKKGPFNVIRRSTTKVRFPERHFDIPKTPSTVTKMRGVNWYLCLKRNELLTFKHESDVQRSDYLLAEMKSSTEFELTCGEKTYLLAKYNNLNVLP